MRRTRPTKGVDANPRESGSWWQRDLVSTEYGEMLLLLTQTIASLGALNAQH
jgi:hypothetical protein